jgi:hypothetical protein
MEDVMMGAGVTQKCTSGTGTLRGVSRGNGRLIAAASWLLGVVGPVGIGPGLGPDHQGEHGDAERANGPDECGGDTLYRRHHVGGVQDGLQPCPMVRRE